jgi:PASTA domain-containing protein
LIAICLLPGCGEGSPATQAQGALHGRELRQLDAAARSSARFHRRQASGKTVRVPAVVGEQFDAAVREIHGAGLAQKSQGFSGSVGEPSYSGRCLRVSTQSPVAGARVAKNTTVSIMYGGCGPHRYPTGLHPGD